MSQKWWCASSLLASLLVGPIGAQAQVQPTAPPPSPTPAPHPDTQTAEAAPSPQQPAPPTVVPLKDGKLALNADASRYLKLTLLTQAWVRYNENNPGSRLAGQPEPRTLDAGIRRFRIQFYGQLTDRVFIYSQIGINNFYYLSERKAGFFLHDAVSEFAVSKGLLSLGTGLTAWNGLSRFTSSATGSILGLDLPLEAETTNDVNDQFGRKLSVYAKGKLSKLDYRLAVTKPLIVPANAPAVGLASFSSLAPKAQYQAYLQWQFLEQESNLTPYNAGTYLGKKRVFNIGAGFIAQPKAMWYKNAGSSDTVQTAMKQFAVDAYYDAPIGAAERGQALSAYAAFYHLDYGPNYTRNTAPMNPITSSAGAANILNGPGNGFPAYGTGNVLYGQVGYKLPDNLVGSTTFMPYVSVQHANYKRLNDAMNYYDAGLNWLLVGHTSKFTVAYQNRPIFTLDGLKANRTGSRSAVVAQYQVSFN